jgi:hypothetical protein
MPKYKVYLTRTIEQECIFVVDAPDADTARDEVYDLDWDELPWEHVGTCDCCDDEIKVEETDSDSADFVFHGD